MEAVFKVCYVVWTDVMHFKRETPDGWLSHEQLQTLIDESSSSVGLQMKSVGWLVHQDNDKLVLTGTVNDFSASDVIVIPRALVVGFRVLEDPPADPENGPVPVIVLPDSPIGTLADSPVASPGQPVGDSRAVLALDEAHRAGC